MSPITLPPSFFQPADCLTRVQDRRILIKRGELWEPSDELMMTYHRQAGAEAQRTASPFVYRLEWYPLDPEILYLTRLNRGLACGADEGRFAYSVVPAEQYGPITRIRQLALISRQIRQRRAVLNDKLVKHPEHGPLIRAKLMRLSLWDYTMDLLLIALSGSSPVDPMLRHSLTQSPSLFNEMYRNGMGYVYANVQE